MELSETDQQRLDLLLFLVRLLLLATPLYVLLWIDWNPVWLRQLQAGIGTAVLDLTGMAVTHSGTWIEAPGLAVDVSVDSTGWKSMLAVMALVLAVTDLPRRERVIGLVAGLATVFAANILRLTSMIYAVVVWGISYELIHTFLWRWGLTAVLLSYWLIWLHWATTGSLPFIHRIQQYHDGQRQQPDVTEDQVEEAPGDDEIDDDHEDAEDSK